MHLFSYFTSRCICQLKIKSFISYKYDFCFQLIRVQTNNIMFLILDTSWKKCLRFLYGIVSFSSLSCWSATHLLHREGEVKLSSFPHTQKACVVAPRIPPPSPLVAQSVGLCLCLWMSIHCVLCACNGPTFNVWCFCVIMRCLGKPCLFCESRVCTPCIYIWDLAIKGSGGRNLYIWTTYLVLEVWWALHSRKNRVIPCYAYLWKQYSWFYFAVLFRNILLHSLF